MPMISKRTLSIALLASGTAAVLVTTYVTQSQSDATRPQAMIAPDNDNSTSRLDQPGKTKQTAELDKTLSELNTTGNTNAQNQHMMDKATNEQNYPEVRPKAIPNKYLEKFTAVESIAQFSEDELQTEIGNIEAYIDDNKLIEQLNDEKFNEADVKQLTEFFEHLARLRHDQINQNIDKLNTQLNDYEAVQVSMMQRYENGEFYDDKQYNEESINAESEQEYTRLDDQREALLAEDADALLEPEKQAAKK